MAKRTDLTDLKLKYVEFTPFEEERLVDIKESPARILMSSALRGGSVTKGGVEKMRLVYKVSHVFTLIDHVYAIGF